jgi:hypothetical protein
MACSSHGPAVVCDKAMLGVNSSATKSASADAVDDTKASKNFTDC